MTKKIYPWERFWCRRGGSFSLEDGGYLVDPNWEHSSIYQPDVVSDKKLDEIPCVALLGEPGIGKSQALRVYRQRRRIDLYAEEEKLLYLNLRSFGEESRLERAIFSTQEFASWQAGDCDLEIVLDSLDECMLHIKTVASLLADMLEEKVAESANEVTRLRLRIACRTRDWPAQLQECLSRIWGQGQYAECELMPLRKVDVELAASQEGIETNSFMDTLARNNLVPFAIKPVTLQMLLREGSGLSAGEIDLYNTHCLHLCRDLSASREYKVRSGSIDPAARFAISERIAALSVFGNRSSIFTGSNELESRPSEELLLSDLIGGSEVVNGNEIEVTKSTVWDALDTALFVGGVEARLNWSHRTYAEFLAASYLTRRQVSLEQIKDLLLIRLGNKDVECSVIPQLRETAAWLAAQDQPLAEEILEIDPKCLLRARVTHGNPLFRARLVDAILDLASEDKITDFELWRHYGALEHPGLEAQLRPFIGDSGRGAVACRVAYHIAQACAVEELSDELADIALDGEISLGERDLAARAVAKMGRSEARARLRPLLAASDEDIRDELKGSALTALWPDHLTADELFACINKPKDENYFGAYKRFLADDLLARLKPDHLPSALAWVRDLPDSYRGVMTGINELVVEILRRAWKGLKEGVVLDLLGDIVVRRARDLRSIIAQGNEADETQGDPVVVDRRRLLLKSIVGKRIGKIDRSLRALRLYGLVTWEDFPWLIQNIKMAETALEKRRWAEQIRSIFDESSEQLECIWAAMAEISELAEIFEPLFSPIDLESDLARSLQQANEYSSRTLVEEISPEPPLAHSINDRLDRFEAGELDSWPMFCRDLTREAFQGSWHYTAGLSSDMTSLPGWACVDEGCRIRILNAALQYLVQSDIDAERWLGTQAAHNPAFAGYKALRILHRFRREVLLDLETEVWRRWAPVVIGYPEESNSTEIIDAVGPLVALAYQKSPDVMIHTLEKTIDRQNSKDGYPYGLWKLDWIWDERLVEAMVEKARDPVLKPGFVAALLEAILRSGVGLLTAQELARDMFQSRTRRKGIKREKAIACGALLCLYGGELGWRSVYKVLRRAQAFGRELVTELVRRDHHAEKTCRALSEDSLGSLYVWLARIFPHATDPKVSGAHALEEREMIAHFRDRIIPYLQYKGTLTSLAALQRVASELPDLRWLRSVATEARELVLKNSWEGSSPFHILQLIERSDRRLVGSESQLREAILAILGEYQRDLLGENRAVEDIWNEKPRTPKKEEWISNHLARYLKRKLRARRVVVNREVEIREGEKTDIHVVAFRNLPAGDSDQVQVIIEVKGCWNKGLRKDMRDQLRDRYLLENQCSQGLYVVVWCLCGRWACADYRKDKTPEWSLEEARIFFESQARELSTPDEALSAYVLDATLRPKSRLTPEGGSSGQLF